MPDEMNFVLALVDQRDGPHRLIGECECMLAGPWSAGLGAVVLRRQHFVALAQHLREDGPLAGTGTGAMQSYHLHTAFLPRRIHGIDVHGSVHAGSGLFKSSGGTRDCASHRAFTAVAISERVRPM